MLVWLRAGGGHEMVELREEAVVEVVGRVVQGRSSWLLWLMAWRCSVRTRKG